MQLSHSFPVIAASLSDTSKSPEFLGYQLPGKSSVAVPCCLQKVPGIFFPPEDGDQSASLSSALRTNSCSISWRAAARSQPASSCRQPVPPRVPSVSQLEPVVTLRWELVLSSAVGLGHRRWMKHNLTPNDYWKHMVLGVKWAKEIFWVENQRR